MHGFSKEKRAWFVEAMGEERVRALEIKLFGLEKELEGAGVRFKMKDFIADMTFADAEAARLFDVFIGISMNIAHSPELDIPAKVAKMRQAVADLASRIGGGGKAKEKTSSHIAASKYVIDLAPNQRAKAKALQESGDPAATYVADLMEKGAVQS